MDKSVVFKVVFFILYFITKRAALRATSGRRKDVDGIRTVKYNRLALEFKDLYTWVFIRVKEAQIMQVIFWPHLENALQHIRRAETHSPSITEQNLSYKSIDIEK